MQFEINFTNGLSLLYQLEDSPIAKQWADLIVQRNVTECCKINHFMGWKTPEMIQEKINRLYELADYINTFAPEKVIKHEINDDTWRKALQIMHVHFPEMKNDPKYMGAWPSLTEYNDIIHWLESIFIKGNTDSGLLRLTLDFNKTIFEFYPLPDSAFEHYTPFFDFGSLCLHYTHVGRHAYELFSVNDFETPKEQFVPQRTFNASTRLSFFDNFYSTKQKQDLLMARWNKFYIDRGGKEFWGIDINDPKIAFGYCKLGQLIDIKENSVSLSIPTTPSELHDFRSKLIQTKVIDWNIKGA